MNLVTWMAKGFKDQTGGHISLWSIVGKEKSLQQMILGISISADLKPAPHWLVPYAISSYLRDKDITVPIDAN